MSKLPRFSGTGVCSGCGREILWGRTAKQKWTPVDPDVTTIYDKDGEIRRGHIPHHATCPKVERFRKKNVD